MVRAVAVRDGREITQGAAHRAVDPRGRGSAKGRGAGSVAHGCTRNLIAVLLFRHADTRFPFLWEGSDQPSGRWHGAGEGPVHYLADTPDGAWAEFLRHEEITDAADLDGVERALWAVELDGVPDATPDLPADVLRGSPASYGACQAEARRLRDTGGSGLVAPSAALLPGEARGWVVSGGLKPGPDRDGWVVVLFGRRPDLVGWAVVRRGKPDPSVLERVHQF